MKRLLLALFASLAAACSPGPPPPATLDPAHELCSFCRMAISDASTAAQLVAPYEEPRFFDDLGCLRDFLNSHPPRATGTVTYVMDHHSRAWVPAAAALYTRVPGLATPMGSGLLAHRDAASRSADPEVAGLPALLAAEVFPIVPPGGPP